MNKTILVLVAIMLLGGTPVNGQNVIVWDFLTREGDRTSMTDNFSRAFEAALVEYSDYTLVERSPELKAMIDRERAVREIFDISNASLSALKVKGAEIAVFGDVYDDVESNEFHITVTFQSFEGEKLLIKSKLMPRDKVTDNLRRQAAMEELVKEVTSRTAPNTSPNSSGANQLMRVIKNEFIFDLDKCSLANRNATCEFTISNNGEDRGLAIVLETSGRSSRTVSGDRFVLRGSSVLYDEFNNAITVARIQFANAIKEKNGFIEAVLISGRPAEAKMAFMGLSSKAAVIARLDLVCYDGETGTQFIVTFRNVPLMRV